MSNEETQPSKYPAARPEIIADIIALDCLVADLIAKCKGNARELDELVGVLDAHLGYCESERDVLLPLVVRSSPPKSPLTLTDLPIEEQKMFFATSLFNAMTLSSLTKATGIKVDCFVLEIAKQINIEMAKFADEQITSAIDGYLQNYRKYPQYQGFEVEMPTDTRSQE